MAESYQFEETVGNSLIVREPIGVVGCITPWNYPLHQIAAKVAFALAAGCTVVLKPSEVAPVDAFILAEIIDEVGLPAGVFNLVSGIGPVVGEAIAAHPDVDMVSFTGSTRAGKRVAQLGAENDQEGRPRARRQVGQRAPRRPRRRRLRQGRRPTASASPSSTPARPARRSPACSCRASAWREAEEIAAAAAGKVVVGEPVRRGRAPRAAGLGRPARPGAGLHPEGHRRGRHARHRRPRRARGPRHRLLRPADGVLRRHART